MWKGYETFERGMRHVEGVHDMWKGYDTFERGTRHVGGV